MLEANRLQLENWSLQSTKIKWNTEIPNWRRIRNRLFLPRIRCGMGLPKSRNWLKYCVAHCQHCNSIKRLCGLAAIKFHANELCSTSLDANGNINSATRSSSYFRKAPMVIHVVPFIFRVRCLHDNRARHVKRQIVSEANTSITSRILSAAPITRGSTDFIFHMPIIGADVCS